MPDAIIGASVNLGELALRGDAAIFGESQSRFIVSLAAGDLELFMAAIDSLGVMALPIGSVGGEKLVIDGFVDLPVKSIRERWEATLIDYVR